MTSSNGGSKMTSDSKLDYPKASESLVRGGLYTYAAGLFLLIAFISPYWISSYDDAFSEFKNMGMWQYCFDGFRYPYYQFDKRFTGCYGIYSSEYYVIREWLLPGWLLFIQMCVTLSFIFSFSAQIILGGIVTRYPLQLVLMYEYLLTMVSFALTAASAVLLMFAVLLFPLNCWRRDWLLYPLYNHLSFSYYLALISFFVHAWAAWVLYKESKRAWEHRKESRNLVMQMYPQHDRHHGFNGY
uniref:Protein with signal anchor n=1 Tax=Cacopsylla melanoneura TaxID=428564 RepID=A0A8D9DR50_9HEMI